MRQKGFEPLMLFRATVLQTACRSESATDARKSKRRESNPQHLVWKTRTQPFEFRLQNKIQNLKSSIKNRKWRSRHKFVIKKDGKADVQTHEDAQKPSDETKISFRPTRQSSVRNQSLLSVLLSVQIKIVIQLSNIIKNERSDYF